MKSGETGARVKLCSHSTPYERSFNRIQSARVTRLLESFLPVFSQPRKYINMHRATQACRHKFTCTVILKRRVTCEIQLEQETLLNPSHLANHAVVRNFPTFYKWYSVMDSDEGVPEWRKKLIISLMRQFSANMKCQTFHESIYFRKKNHTMRRKFYRINFWIHRFLIEKPWNLFIQSQETYNKIKMKFCYIYIFNPLKKWSNYECAIIRNSGLIILKKERKKK